MKSKGIVRKLDKLGRITIPMELCKKMGIVRGQTFLDILCEDDKVLLQQEENSVCVFCKTAGNLIEIKDKHICRVCLGRINDTAKKQPDH